MPEALEHRHEGIDSFRSSRGEAAAGGGRGPRERDGQRAVQRVGRGPRRLVRRPSRAQLRDESAEPAARSASMSPPPPPRWRAELPRALHSASAGQPSRRPPSIRRCAAPPRAEAALEEPPSGHVLAVLAGRRGAARRGGDGRGGCKAATCIVAARARHTASCVWRGIANASMAALALPVRRRVRVRRSSAAANAQMQDGASSQRELAPQLLVGAAQKCARSAAAPPARTGARPPSAGRRRKQPATVEDGGEHARGGETAVSAEVEERCAAEARGRARVRVLECVALSEPAAPRWRAKWSAARRAAKEVEERAAAQQRPEGRPPAAPAHSCRSSCLARKVCPRPRRDISTGTAS